MTGRPRPGHRGVAAVALIVVLIILDLIVIRLVVGGGRDHMLTSHRVQTVQAFYAAESGIHMAVRERMVGNPPGTDEDGDGGIGTISGEDPADDNTDPPVGDGYVAVTSSAGGGQTTLSSAGRTGGAQRELEAVLD